MHWSMTLWIWKSQGMVMILAVLVVNWLDSMPRSRVESLTRPRYNCAKPSGDESAKATDWKLVLQSSVNISTSISHEPNGSSAHCDLRAFVDAAGGPTGVAKRGHFFQRSNNGNSSILSRDEPMQVYIEGKSFLRQIFEALTCAFQDQITDFRLQQDGPGAGSRQSPQ
jgi:hypothetical protein